MIVSCSSYARCRNWSRADKEKFLDLCPSSSVLSLQRLLPLSSQSNLFVARSPPRIKGMLGIAHALLDRVRKHAGTSRMILRTSAAGRLSQSWPPRKQTSRQAFSNQVDCPYATAPFGSFPKRVSILDTFNISNSHHSELVTVRRLFAAQDHRPFT